MDGWFIAQLCVFNTLTKLVVIKRYNVENKSALVMFNRYMRSLRNLVREIVFYGMTHGLYSRPTWFLFF